MPNPIGPGRKPVQGIGAGKRPLQKRNPKVDKDGALNFQHRYPQGTMNIKLPIINHPIPHFV